MFEFDLNEMKKIVNGKFITHLCTNCGGRGWYWVDGDSGAIVSGPDPKRELYEYYQNGCEDCGGVGVNIQFL